MNSPHILLVDDDQALPQALSYAEALQLHGVQMQTCDSAQGALELIQEQDYDAIVTDIKMPQMDGLELLARIQELRPEVPTLLITGHIEHSLIIGALRGGAYDFIQKPLDRVSFVAALHRAIQTRQLRRQVHEQQQALAHHAHTVEHLVQERTRDLLMLNQATNMLVHNVLDLSRIQTNTFLLQCTRCNLVELCQHVLQEYTAGTDLALTFVCREERIEAEVDHERISRVLITVLTHAHTYSPKSSPVIITLCQTEQRAMIMIHDMGIGMTEEVLAHHFDPFSWVPQGEIQANSPDGVGLGLSISQKIVERHAGSIKIGRSPGRGNACRLMVPLVAAPPTEHTGGHRLQELSQLSSQRRIGLFRDSLQS